MISIGVAGHRYIAEVDRLQAGIHRALRQIKVAYPGEDWVVLSALAEGADRLVARVAMGYPAYTRLVVPLPLPSEIYRNDFRSLESKREFDNFLSTASEVISPPPVVPRIAGYRAAGQWIVEHSDVLIVLWDGKPSRGTGSTAEVVAAARKRGLPIAWIRCGNRRPGTDEPTSLGRQQGDVSFERFPVKPDKNSS